jgi:hypothetical protein
MAPSYLGILTEAGALADVTVVPETATQVVRFPAAHAWVVATFLSTGGLTVDVGLRAYDDALDEIGGAIPLGVSPPDRPLALVSVKSRIVALRATEDGIVQATFAGDALERVSEGALMRPGTYVDERGEPRVGAAIAATASRDTVVAVAMDRTNLSSVVFDPFSLAVTDGPTVLAQSPADGGHAIAADAIGGTLGVCYPDGAGPYGGYVGEDRAGPPDADSVRFALLGPDGARIGEPVTIATDLRYVAACAVAAAGRDRYVVVFWNAARDSRRHSILAAAVTVRR